MDIVKVMLTWCISWVSVKSIDFIANISCFSLCRGILVVFQLFNVQNML